MNRTEIQSYHTIEAQVLFPRLNEEQSINTMLFLQLVADTYETGYCCAILEQHLYKKANYKKCRDSSGDLQYALSSPGYN